MNVGWPNRASFRCGTSRSRRVAITMGRLADQAVGSPAANRFRPPLGRIVGGLLTGPAYGNSPRIRLASCTRLTPRLKAASRIETFCLRLAFKTWV